MDLSLLKGGAIIGAVVGFWGQIKEILWRITSIIIQKVDICTEDAHDAIIAHLVKTHKKINIYDKKYGGDNEIYKTGKYGLVPYEKFGRSTVFFIASIPKRWINFPFMFKTIEQQSNNTDANSNYNSNQDKVYSSIIFLRGTLNIEQIFIDATKTRNNISWQIDATEEKEGRFDIFYLPDKEKNNHAYYSKSKIGYTWYKQGHYRLLGVNHEELGREKSKNKALDNLFFPREVKELIHTISLWVKSEQWYKEKSIPWKRGWLLYGVPGTGKTALVRAFAEDLDMPIYVFSLSQMSNSDLINCWRNMQLNIPCIALIEDIDNVFHKRQNICQNRFSPFSSISNSKHQDNDTNEEDDGSMVFSTPLTFDCLLNCIDGVDKSNGVFTIITTNDITKIDEAIGQPSVDAEGKKTFVSSRPGRIDKAIELTYMSNENKREMANKILGDFPAELKSVLDEIETRNNETPAQFQEYCAQIAIKEHWNAKSNVL